MNTGIHLGPDKTQPISKKRSMWWRVLLSTLGLYVLGVILLLFTQNPNLFPTVVLLGSFMVPAAYVAFFYERRHLSKLDLPTTALSFFYGGLVGVFAASILEPLFISQLDFITVFIIGFIEEFVKILGILLIYRKRDHTSELDGIILGAAAGMGFAALESTGYAFTSFLISRGNLSATVAVTLLRGVLSPLGHGTWTAILVGILFRESRVSHFRISLRVLGAYLLVVLLHGLWDGLPGVVDEFTGSGLDVVLTQSTVGLIGLFILWREWSDAVKRQILAIKLLLESHTEIFSEDVSGPEEIEDSAIKVS